MTRLPLWSLLVVGALLVLNPAVSAVLGFYSYEDPALAATAIAVYLLASLTSVFYYRSRKMPIWLAVVNLLVAITIPQMVHAAIDSAATGSQSSWFVTGVGALMAVTAIRGQPAISWAGTAIMALDVLVWGGISDLFDTGLAGALALVVAANAISYSLDQSEIETEQYLQKAIKIQAMSAAESATRQERSRRLSETLEVAYPLLNKISRGEIDEKSRQEAKILEAQLRDGIRGRNLINEKLKASIYAARQRGVEVTVLDEGGLDAISDLARDEIRNRLATELDQVVDGRVTIRAPHGSKTSATFVASRSGTATPDVFLRL
jgi:hypothetical protein